MHFGLRGRRKGWRLLISKRWWLRWTRHFFRRFNKKCFFKDFSWRQELCISKGLTKGGGLRVKPRLATPKMFATGERRCPVAFLKKYLSKRPAELKTAGPVYLSVIDKPQTSVWYKKVPMGKNTINNIMKTMKENSPLKDVCQDKKLTNHSARKTVVKKLKTSGIPKCET